MNENQYHIDFKPLFEVVYEFWRGEVEGVGIDRW